MAKNYSTKISTNRSRSTQRRRPTASGKLKKSKPAISRLDLARANSPKAKARLGKYRLSKANQRKLKKVLLLVVSIGMVAVVIGGIWLFAYMQKLNDELPSIDDPFKNQEFASIVTDRNGVELYKWFSDDISYSRDPVNIADIPEQVKWAFLAAEDIDFYNHQGFDLTAIIRCGLSYVTSAGKNFCGGSTITQQVVKLRTVGDEVKLERKIKEILMSIKVEQAYTKDEILQLYLTIAPFGGSVYGITTAADFYYHKNVSDLTLAEAAVLASIVQNPPYMSPTVGLPDPETARVRVEERQKYVLGQMEKYLDKINNETRSRKGDQSLADVVTMEQIEAARTEVIAYQPPVLRNVKAGHFVDYVKVRLTEENYKYGEEPFTSAELMTGGYKITTTMDYDLQQIAEQAVANAVSQYSYYGIGNGALISLVPSTGEVITMVGSKSYSGVSEGCDAAGINCTYDPQVNIITSKQSPGSSTKPMGYYEAYAEGKLFTGSLLPDIPLDVPGYNLKNWNSGVSGVGGGTYAQNMLVQSLNLPAIQVIQLIGVEKFVQVMQNFGYSTFDDPSQYGPSAILGGSDVIPLEHAQAYTVFANGGDLVKNEVILKIEDRDGNVVFEHEVERSKVADERAVYMLNYSVLNSHNASWDGRAVAAKTGTSENNRDLLLAIWSPDFVTVGWMGNNNNLPLSSNAFAIGVMQPWVVDYMAQVGNASYFGNKTNFTRPGGLHEGGGCSGDCIGQYVGIAGGIMMDGVSYPIDNVRTKYTVCTDQMDKLARPIDIAVGMSTERVITTYINPVAEYQDDLDKFMMDQYLAGTGYMPNTPLTEYCTVNRGDNGEEGPWIYSINAQDGATLPVSGGKVTISGSAYTTSGTVTGISFSLDGSVIGTISGVNADGTFSAAFNTALEFGQYGFSATVTDSSGRTKTKSTTVYVGSDINPNLSISYVPSGGTYTYGTQIGGGLNIAVNLAFAGAGNVSTPLLYVSKDGGSYTQLSMSPGSGKNFTALYGGGLADDDINSTYTFYATVTKGTGLLKSAASSITVVEN